MMKKDEREKDDGREGGGGRGDVGKKNHALRLPVQCCGLRESSTSHTDDHAHTACQQPPIPTNPSEIMAKSMSQSLSRCGTTGLP